MVINELSFIPAGNDPARFAWNNLGRFQNTRFVSDLIMKLHRVPASQKNNIIKQSENVRQCLIQAKEYFDASQAVSLATKPLLIYYSLMSFALSEILIKQDGMSSLEKARGENAHHGLQFVNINKKTDVVLEESASKLIARPIFNGKGLRVGTFDLWHRSAREQPLFGKVEIIEGFNRIETKSIILSAVDQRLSLIPNEGISLLECIKWLHGMEVCLMKNRIETSLVRASCKIESNTNSRSSFRSIVFHPQNEKSLQSCYAEIKCDASVCFRGQLNIHELNSGCILKWQHDESNPPFYISFPGAIQWNSDYCLFSFDNKCLNEFGVYYVVFYILGNYVRYYPDNWIRDVESSSPLALAALELISIAERRLPVLALSELYRSYYFEF